MAWTNRQVVSAHVTVAFGLYSKVACLVSMLPFKSRTVKLKLLILVTALIFPRQHPSLLCLLLLREKATPILLPLRRLLSFFIAFRNSFADLHVRLVASFPDNPSEWKIVNSFPNFKIKIVDSFPDFTIMYVDSFPGVNR